MKCATILKILVLVSLFGLSNTTLAQQGNWVVIAEAMAENKPLPTSVPASIQLAYVNWQLAKAGGFQKAFLELSNLSAPYAAPDAWSKAASSALAAHAWLALGFPEKAKNQLETTEFQKPVYNDPVLESEIKGLLGIIAWQDGKYREANELLNVAFHQRVQALGTSHPLSLALLNNNALIWRENDPNRALTAWLEIYNNHVENTLGASVLTNLALSYEKIHKPDSVQYFLVLAANRWRALQGENGVGLAFVYSCFGNHFLSAQQPDSALYYFQKALAIYQYNFGFVHPEVAQTLNRTAEVWASLNNYEKAFSALDSALTANYNSSTKNYLKPDLALQSLFTRAKVLESRHYEKSLSIADLRQSLAYLQACDSQINLIRNSRSNVSDQLRLGSISIQVYETAVEVALRLAEITTRTKYYQEIAFQYCEKNKSSLLKQNLSKARAASFYGIPDSLITTERNLQATIAFYEQKLAESNSETMTSLNEQLLQKRFELEQHTQMLSASYPSYYAVRYGSDEKTVDQLANKLDDSTLVVSYFLSKNRMKLHIFFLSKNGLHCESKTLPSDWLQQCRAFRNALRLDAPKVWIESGNVLSDLFLGSQIKDRYKLLVFIPEGILVNLPFEALFYRPYSYANYQENPVPPLLIKKHAVAYDYAADLWLRKTQRTNTGNSALLLAPVNFEHPGNIPTLPGSEEEVNAISGLLAKNNIGTELLFGKAATLGAFKQSLLHKPNYIHLATHGIADEEQPELSRVYTSFNKDGGCMYLADIYGVNCPARLVTLSACQSAGGRINEGEGVIGLTRAWRYAGAQAVLSSLWNVNDNATQLLMTNFYNSLMAVEPAPYALQKAKIKLLSTNSYALPSFWSPFVLIGNCSVEL